MTAHNRVEAVIFFGKNMARKKAKPLAPIFKVKPLKVKRVGVSLPKLPRIKASKIKI